MCNKVLAHFNPRSYWNTTNVTDSIEALPMCEELGWDLLQGVLDVVGVGGVLLLPASAIENNRDSDVIAASFEVVVYYVSYHVNCAACCYKAIRVKVN